MLESGAKRNILRAYPHAGAQRHRDTEKGIKSQGDCMNEIFLTMVGYPICKTVSSLLEIAFFDLFPPFFCPISHTSCLKGIANRGAVAHTPLVYLMNLTHAIALTWGQECKIATSGG